MKTEIRLTPESEEEIELLEKVSEARNYAVEEMDMDPSTVAGIFSQIAAGLCTESQQPEPEERLLCPECEAPVEDVKAGSLGADPTVQPCGCETKWEELPPDLYLEDT